MLESYTLPEIITLVAAGIVLLSAVIALLNMNSLNNYILEYCNGGTNAFYKYSILVPVLWPHVLARIATQRIVHSGWKNGLRLSLAALPYILLVWGIYQYSENFAAILGCMMVISVVIYSAYFSLYRPVNKPGQAD